MRISFLGAASEVTGSCYPVEVAGKKFLLDCGLFQGGNKAYRKNLAALRFAFPVKALDFAIVTHAHLDHSGLLPRLTALGFRGPVFATATTCDLLEVLLLDSAHIQEKEAEWANRHQHERHARRGWEKAPLYTVTQARECLRKLRRRDYEQTEEPQPGIRFMFRDAGHILGSAIVELWLTDKGVTRKLVFSGDLGQPGRPALDERVCRLADGGCSHRTYAASSGTPGFRDARSDRLAAAAPRSSANALRRDGGGVDGP